MGDRTIWLYGEMCEGGVLRPRTVKNRKVGCCRMTDTQMEDVTSAFEATKEEFQSGLEAEPLLTYSQTPGQWPKDHCDYLLDTIDAELDQMQSQDYVSRVSGTVTEGVDFRGVDSHMTEMEGHDENAFIGATDNTSNSTADQDEEKYTKREEYKWRLTQLLGTQETGNMGYMSDSNSAESVCTEDFVTRFREGMVDPKMNSATEIDHEKSSLCDIETSAFKDPQSAEGNCPDMSVGKTHLATLADSCSTAGDTFAMNTAKRQDILQQFKMELQNTLQLTVTTSAGKKTRHRTNSQESLGGRISRLSQINVIRSQSLLYEELMSNGESTCLSEGHTELQLSFDSENMSSVDTCIPGSLQQDQKSVGVLSEEREHKHDILLPLNNPLTREEQQCDDQNRPSEDNTILPEVPSIKPQSLQDKPEILEIMLPDNLPTNLLPSCQSLASPKELRMKSTQIDDVDSLEKCRSLKEPEELRCTSNFFCDNTDFTKSSELIQKSPLKASKERQNIGADTFNSNFGIAHYTREQKEESREVGLCEIEKQSLRFGTTLPSDSGSIYKDENGHTNLHYVQNGKTGSMSSCLNLEARSKEPLLTHLNLQSTLNDDDTDTTQCKHLAGVPVLNFDSVAIDSDLDSVRTEKVRAHFWKAMDDRKGPGRSTRKFLCPRTEPKRKSTTNKAATDDDEEEDEEETFQQSFASPDWKSSSPVHWGSNTNRVPDSSWNCTEHSPGAFLRRFGTSVEELVAEKAKLEDSVTKLQRDLVLEEERLLQKRLHIREVDQSLSDITHQKKKILQELESLRHALDVSEKDVKKAENRMKESQSRADERRTELALLEFKRESSLKELQELEQELSAIRRQCSSARNSQLTVFQSEISSLVSERDELKTRLRHLESSVSFMERQELERQLNSTKTELFSEQRASRAKMEELHERLKESQKKLDDKTAEGTLLQEKVLQLSSQLRELETTTEAQIKSQSIEAEEVKKVLNKKIMDLTSTVSEQSSKIAGLEKILSEKELEFLRLREVISTVGAEKEAQITATNMMKEEHKQRLIELHQEKNKEKELHLAELRKELQCLKQQEIQQFAESMEQIKTQALNDQAASFKKETETLMKVVESKDEEISKLKEGIQLQKASMKKLAGELKHEAKEMVQSSLFREQRKFEAEKREALQLQRENLEEERHRDLAAMKEALERERRACLSLQNMSVELQNRIQEQELLSRSLQKEKQEALEELRTALREEKLEEFRKLREELEQERAREVDRLKERLLQLEEEVRLLQEEQSEASFREKELQAQVERAERSLVREITSACERLQDPLKGTPGRVRAISPSRTRHGSPSRLSSNHALQILNGLAEETNQYIQELRQEAEAQKRTVLHIQREKDRELKQQREQNHLEKEAALDVLKERLIQEHIEEITNLQRNQLRESGNGDSQTLRKQLREKDNELRAIQRNMARWKDETACKLARKFEEELNDELEKRFSRNKSTNPYRSPEKTDSEMQRLSMERSNSSHLRSASSPSLNAASVHGQHDFGALKVLRQLQGRVKELRAENTVCHGGSMEDLSTLRGDLRNSSREKRHKLLDSSFLQYLGASGRK
ncbi:trichohyalin-like [Pleurodeles waltl]|uniref:trichohyalin-like n=1 Tax=Pleurodeles waltl TaxID=8319 RepID=UPI00370952B0